MVPRDQACSVILLAHVIVLMWVFVLIYLFIHLFINLSIIYIYIHIYTYIYMELITSTRMTSTWDNLPAPASQGHPCWDYRQEFKHSFKQNPPCTRT